MTIPYGKQSISETDIEAVVAVLRSDYLTQGPVVPRFEQAVADYCGVKHALAVNSATSALHIACLALGVGPGDRVWTSPVTFVASANCALYCGAIIDFVDICPKTYNLCPGALETKLIAAQKNGTLPKVVIPVHLTGQPCDMERIHALSKIYGFRIIEDASHAIGGKYQGQPIGNCTFSDISVFSFHPVKIITTAEGGMAITNDKILAGKMALYRSHGITRDPEQFTLQVDEEGRPEVRSQESGVGSQESGVRSQESGVRNQESDSPLPPATCPKPHAPCPWYYQQITLGFNYRMTELQAALGLSQMERLDDFVTRRHEIARRYNQALADLPLVLPHQAQDSYSAYHLYVIRIRGQRVEGRGQETGDRGQETGDRKPVASSSLIQSRLRDDYPLSHIPAEGAPPNSSGEAAHIPYPAAKPRISHRPLFDSLRAAGLGVNLHYIPVHTQPYYQQMGFRWGDFPEAEAYYQTAISIPMYSGMTDEQQDHVIAVLHQLFA